MLAINVGLFLRVSQGGSPKNLCILIFAEDPTRLNYLCRTIILIK